MGNVVDFKKVSKRISPVDYTIGITKELLALQLEINEAMCRHCEVTIKDAGLDITNFEVDKDSFKDFFETNICQFLEENDSFQISFVANIDGVHYRTFTRANAVTEGEYGISSVLFKYVDSDWYSFNSEGKWVLEPDMADIFDLLCEETVEQLLLASVDEIDLSIRVKNELKKIGIFTVGELADIMNNDPKKLLRYSGLGNDAFYEIEGVLKSLNLL